MEKKLKNKNTLEVWYGKQLLEAAIIPRAGARGSDWESLKLKNLAEGTGVAGSDF